MTHFRRVLGYVKVQWRAVTLSIVCALLSAMLFSFSIMAMLPLMKVIMEGESLSTWVYTKVVKDRCGAVVLVPKPTEDGPRRLAIINVLDDTPAAQAGLQVGDVVLDVQMTGAPAQGPVGPEELMSRLARAGSDPVTIIVERFATRKSQTIELTLTDPFWHRLLGPNIDRLIDLLPADQTSLKFKEKSVHLVILVLLVATILRCIFRFSQEYLVRRVAFRSIMQLRLQAYRNVIRLPLTYFASNTVTDTMSRFIRDSTQINQGISTLLGKAIREPLVMIGAAGGAFLINHKMTGVVMLGAPMAAWVISKLGRKMKKATKRQLVSWSQMLGRLQETLLGARVVKGYHQEEREDRAFEVVNQRLLKQQFKIAKINAISGPLLESLAICGLCLGMLFATRWIVAGKMGGPEFITLVALLATLGDSGRKMGNVWPRLQAANASAERVYTLVDAEAEKNSPQAKPLARLSGQLEFRDVTFTYPNSQVPAVSEVSLKISAGEVVAVVGPNGSGKTTLLSMIPRFFVPQQGSVLINGTDIANATLATLRGQIGIVTQQTIVFNDTIAWNIAYGNEHASEADIIAAAKRAYAHEFITETTDGYDTIIGQQGITLSGGQLQRLAIARAILRDPAILILDEAMSQIDADSEAKIQQAVSEFVRGRTSFVIAHRLSTIIDSDRIAVLDKGRLVAQGPHDELLQSCTLYRQLYETQFLG